MDEEFKKVVLEGVVATIKTTINGKGHVYPSTKVVSEIYEGTSAGSPARRLFVDFYVWKAVGAWDYEGLPGEFLADLVRELITTRKKPEGEDPWVQSLEKYYEGGTKLDTDSSSD